MFLAKSLFSLSDSLMTISEVVVVSPSTTLGMGLLDIGEDTTWSICV